VKLPGAYFAVFLFLQVNWEVDGINKKLVQLPGMIFQFREEILSIRDIYS
jgi:hypothetical protein